MSVATLPKNIKYNANERCVRPCGWTIHHNDKPNIMKGFSSFLHHTY